MEILVTGTRGFVGSHTRERLNARAFIGDIKESSDWEKNLTGGETILHIAGVRTETDTDFAVNAYSIDKLFEAAKRINKLPKKIVLASSQAVYMENIPHFVESAELNPTTTYGQSKLLGERITQRWCLEQDIPLVILRYSTVLGAGVREKSKMSGPLFAWTKAAMLREPIKVFQDGEQSRDYIHINDIVSANIRAISLPDGVYNVGGGKPIKLIELAKWVQESAHSNSEILIMGGEPSPSDPKEMYSDISKLLSQGWQPRKTAKDAVKEFVNSQLS